MTDNVVSLHERNGLPRTLSPEACVELVRSLVNEGGRVVMREHLYDRMEERDISNAQVFTVLRRGELVAGPKWSDAYANWTFTLRADTAGQLVTVGAAIDTDLMGLAVVVITVFC